MSYIWLLRSWDTWGEYEYIHGAFDTEEMAEQAAEENLQSLKRDNRGFGWAIDKVHLNKFKAW